MENVIIYTRVSTDEQANNGYSLKHQKDVLERYCAIKGMNIVQHFQDDYSAKDFDRPAFSMLMEYVKNNRKNVDTLLFTRWDRFSRNIEAAYKTIRILRNLGVDVNAIEQPLDLSQPDSKIMLAVYLAVPEVENDKNSLRTTEGMRRAQKEGCWTSKAVYGYDNHRNEAGQSTMKFNDKAPLVKEAFTLFVKGIYSIEEVRQMMKPKGMSISKQQFNYMIKNISYAGKVRIKAWKKEDEQIVEGLHEGIVSLELYQQAQAIINGRKRHNAQPKNRTPKLPLRGFLVCQKCGGNLTGSGSKSRNGEKHYYYHCQKGCKERFRADTANANFITFLNEIKIKPEVAELYSKIIKDVFKQNEADKGKQLAFIDKEIQKIQERLNSAEDNLMDQVITPLTYEKMKKRYEDKMSELIRNQTELKFADSNFTKYLKYSLHLLLNLDHYYKESELPVKQKLIGSIFPEKLTFSDNKYRTTKFNEVLNLISCKSIPSSEDNKKRVGIATNPSKKAPFGFSLSNQFKEDLKELYQFQAFTKDIDAKGPKAQTA